MFVLNKKTMNIKVISSVFMLSLSMIATDAMAINGILFYGVGARNRAMGGANGAAPVDSSTILINPAGIGRVGTTADLGVHLLQANRSMDTSNASNPAGLVNTAAGYQESGQKYYLTPTAGITYKDSTSKWGFGGLIAGVAGEGSTYAEPRTTLGVDPAGVNDFDRGTFLFIIKGIPAISYEVNDKLSLGFGLHINAALFSADLLNANLVQTQGSGRLDIAYGYGAQIGFIYDVNEAWSVGGSYTTEQRFEDWEYYEDLVPGFGLPPEIRGSVAFRPTDKLLLTTDLKLIQWTEIDVFDQNPQDGGFGWDDQITVGVGAAYEFNNTFTGRMGVNHGESQIKTSSTFANALVPTVYETHLAVGGDLNVYKNNYISFSFVRTLKNAQTDDGSGDAFSQAGQGTTIEYDGWDMDVVWTVKF
jgi:long-chain fatty acid transport protein